MTRVLLTQRDAGEMADSIIYDHRVSEGTVHFPRILMEEIKQQGGASLGQEKTKQQQQAGRDVITCTHCGLAFLPTRC